jgi:hypothetical protein
VIVAIPVFIGDTNPEVAFIVAIPGDVVLLHVPPVATFVSVVPTPMHDVAVPVVAGGSGFTVTAFVTIHPTPIT